MYTEIFLVCRGGRADACLNRCPHAGVTLDWKPGACLDPAGELIQCSTQGGRYRMEDGFCIHGPGQAEPGAGGAAEYRRNPRRHVS